MISAPDSRSSKGIGSGRKRGPRHRLLFLVLLVPIFAPTLKLRRLISSTWSLGDASVPHEDGHRDDDVAMANNENATALPASHHDAGQPDDVPMTISESATTLGHHNDDVSKTNNDNATTSLRLQEEPQHDESIPPAFYHAASDPIPVYTKHMAEEAIMPDFWQCSANADAAQNRTIFAFVHVFKAAGTTIRQFFGELVYTCRKTWISVGGGCTDVKPSSTQSGGPWKPCRIEEVVDGRNQKMEHYWDPRQPHFVHPKKATHRSMTSSLLATFADIYGGHARIGTGDHIFASSAVSGNVRYITFLRDPIVRYVSGRLYRDKTKRRKRSFEEVVNTIKEDITNERKNDRYMEKSLSYLLTPVQRVENNRIEYAKLRPLVSQNETTSVASVKAEVGAKLVIQNLHRYNCLVGFTERMPESLHILRRVFLADPDEALKDEATGVFKRYGAFLEKKEDHGNSSAAEGMEGGVQANKSSKWGVSTSAVLEELAKDRNFMPLLEEYVKYERMIHEFAWKMHTLQFEAAVGFDEHERR